ncbi:uncharacterized protein [Castor canadensis]|uniref:Uncharacterized protein n=1 Tax=Castor canadensis TaxID=51338 RepID=A0AC58N260_CASCN
MQAAVRVREKTLRITYWPLNNLIIWDFDQPLQLYEVSALALKNKNKTRENACASTAGAPSVHRCAREQPLRSGGGRANAHLRLPPPPSCRREQSRGRRQRQWRARGRWRRRRGRGRRRLERTVSAPVAPAHSLVFGPQLAEPFTRGTRVRLSAPPEMAKASHRCSKMCERLVEDEMGLRGENQGTGNAYRRSFCAHGVDDILVEKHAYTMLSVSDGSHHPERALLCPIIVNPQGHFKTNTGL